MVQKFPELSLRLRHRITRLMELILDVIDEMNPKTEISETLFVDNRYWGSIRNRLWAAYRQGWADYYAYETWPMVGQPMRARLWPLTSVYTTTANSAGWLLPPSAPFVTDVSAPDVERALRRTGFMAHQAWMYLNGVMPGDHAAVRDGVLMDAQQMAFFYVRGWMDRQDTFKLVADDTDGPAFMVARGTFIGPKRHLVLPMPWPVPVSRYSRRMFITHYVHRRPHCKAVLKLCSIDEYYLDRRVDLVQVQDEEYSSRALKAYLDDDRLGMIHEHFDASGVQDSWRLGVAGDRGYPDGSEDRYGGGGEVAGTSGGSAVWQRPSTVRAEPEGHEQPVNEDDIECVDTSALYNILF